jgi:hypothetical protein
MRRTLLTVAAFAFCAAGVTVGTSHAMPNPAPALELAAACDTLLPGRSPECIDRTPALRLSAFVATRTDAKVGR